MGPLVGLAHRVRSCFPGNVHRGLSGRAAPLVSRNRYTDKTGRTSDHFSSGLLRRLGVPRGFGCFVTFEQIAAAGRASAFRSRAWPATKKLRRASSGIGVKWIRSALASKPLALAVSGAQLAPWLPSSPRVGRVCRRPRRWSAGPSIGSRRFGGKPPAGALAGVRVGAGLIRGAV